MSNPGVILLAETEISGMSFRVEDNIGESIHIHFGLLRIEMTIKDFLSFADDLINVAEKLVGIEGFKYKRFDAVFLSQAVDMLLDVTKITEREVEVASLKTNVILDDGSEELVSVADSRVSKALNGDYSDIEAWGQVNYFGDSNKSRVEKIYRSIEEKGYHPPETGTYIVTCDGGSFMADGCHRSSSILHRYGNIPIIVADWTTRRGDYSDEYVIKGFQEKKKNIEKEKHFLEEKKILRYQMALFLAKRDLVNKRIIIKGGGKHTEEFIKMTRGCNYEIVGILGEKKSDMLKEYKSISEEELETISADVIFISSYRYRCQMHKDVDKFKERFIIYDFYEEGIDKEFFS